MGLVSTNLKCVMDTFSKINSLHQFKKWRDDPEIPKKLIFCLLPEMYVHVFTLVRKRGVICAVASILIASMHRRIIDQCFFFQIHTKCPTMNILFKIHFKKPHTFHE